MIRPEDKTVRVSLALNLRDDYAKSTVPRGAATAFYSVASLKFEAIENPSGYRVFEELPPGPLTIEIQASGYLSERRSVTLPLPNPLNPELVVLKPNWLYAFPPGATLIRGRVEGADGPVEEVQVRLVNTGVESRTGRTGHFVLYFGPLTEVALNNAGFVKAPDGTTSFQLGVSHAEYETRTIPISNIRERSTFALNTAVRLTKR
jgi:hypothetical protein